MNPAGRPQAITRAPVRGEKTAVTNPSIEERVVKIVCNQMGTTPDKVSKETSFVNDLGADSLDTVELVMEFEDEFEINDSRTKTPRRSRPSATR